ncbi:MAG: tyrosine-type recombinase/integrase [Actinomycetota bacterium]
MGHIRDLGKDAPKRWKARYRTPGGKERTRSFRTKAEAKRFLDEIGVSKARGAYVDPNAGKKLFGPFAQSVFSNREVRPATKAKHESLLRARVLPFFGSMPLNAIQRSDVQRFVKELKADGCSPWTVRGCYSVASQVFQEAMIEKLIPASPCFKIELPKLQGGEKRYLSPEAVQRLSEAMPEQHRALVLFAAYMGPRWSECAGLKLENLNLLKREVKIVATVERVKGGFQWVELLKNDASRRTLKLPPFMVEILARHLEGSSSEYVFSQPEGGFLRYDNFRRRVWAPAVEAAGLGGLTFHALRHTAAALMIDTKADPIQVQRRLGHKDIKVTYGTYGHLFPNREAQLNDAIESVFRSVADPLAAPPRPQTSATVSEVGAI